MTELSEQMGISKRRLARGLIAVIPLVFAGAVAPVVRADGTGTAALSAPTTRPTRAGMRGGEGFGNGSGIGTGAPWGLRRLETFTTEEIQSAIAFFNLNSPNRMKYFKQVPDYANPHRPMIQALVRTYRPIANFKDKSPELYGLLIQQIKLRDDAFQLATDVDSGQKDAESKLRDKVTQIVDVSLKARALRINLLQQELANQETKLASDQSDPAALVDPELTAIKADELRLVHRVEHSQGQRGQSMVEPDADADPLATVGPDTAQQP